jgi:hypothetical protein
MNQTDKRLLAQGAAGLVAWRKREAVTNRQNNTQDSG